MARATASVPLTRLSSTNPPACPAHPDGRVGASQAPLTCPQAYRPQRPQVVVGGAFVTTRATRRGGLRLRRHVTASQALSPRSERLRRRPPFSSHP